MTTFTEGQIVNTPAGKARVFEQVNTTVYVELSNGVEHSYKPDQLQDWKEYKNSMITSYTTRRTDALTAQLVAAESMLDFIFKDNPKGRAAFNKVAGDVLITRCNAIIKHYEDETKEKKG